MSGKDPSRQNAPPPSRPHSRSEPPQNVHGSHRGGSPAERPKASDHSRSRGENLAGSSQPANPRDSPQAQSSGSSRGSSPARSGSLQAGSSRDPSGNSASSPGSIHSISSSGTSRSTFGSSHQSASSRSQDGSTYSAVSSHQASSSWSPGVYSAESIKKPELSSRLLEQAHPWSAGGFSSARTSPRSPGQSSLGSPRETPREGEDGHSSRSRREHHRRHHRRRKEGPRIEHSGPGSSGGSGSASSSTSGPSSQASEISSPSDSQQQQKTVPSHRSAGASIFLRNERQRLQEQTMGGGKDHEHRSRSKHQRHRRKHREKVKHDLEIDASQRGTICRKSPLALQSREVLQDKRKPGPLQQTPISPHQVPSRTGQAQETKEPYKNFDEMMKVQRRQSLLSQKAHSEKAKLIIGLSSSKSGKHGQTKSSHGRTDRARDTSPGADADAQTLDSKDGDMFAYPIYNQLFEANPSKSTAGFQRRASAIATLVRNRNWREGSKIFRPSEFRPLDKRVSNVSGDPFFDQSCSLFINNELFEHEAPDPKRKYRPVFVALPIPSSGVVLNPREALAEAGWVKSTPNDPVEKAGGIARSRKSDDQLKRALLEASPPANKALAMKRDGEELEGCSPSSVTHKQMDQDSAAVMKPGPRKPDHKASVATTGVSGNTLPQTPVRDDVNQMPDLWFDPATAWQQQSASVPAEGSPAPSQDYLVFSKGPVSDGANKMPDLWSQALEFDPATAWQQQYASVPAEGSPAPFQVTLQDNQFNQQFGDGTSSVSSFGEQYADSVQDPGFSPPQDLGFSGPQPPNTFLENQIGTLMGGIQSFTFDSYARLNFSAQPTGMWPLSIWKRVKIDVLLMYTKASQHLCAPVSSWQDPLREPLLRTVPYKLRRKALAVFAHLMAYMGDVPTKQSSTWHIQQILSTGIRYRGLRDEVFCQIIKQTTANPSRLSNMKGWQAMAICCGIFLPSDSFYPYMDAHLEQVAGGNISRQGTADQLGKYAHGMVNPLEAAAYALERLRKVKRIGPRRLLPLPKEIEVVETMDTIPTEIALPDGSWQAFILRPMDTSEDVVEHVVNILGLLEARSYGLYQLEPNGVEKLIPSNAYILEVQASCNTLASNPQNIQDIRYGFKKFSKLITLLCGSKNEVPEDNSLTTVVLGSGGLGSGGQQFSEGSLCMLLKRKLYLVDLELLPEASKAVVLAFEYSQAVHDIVQGVHIVSEGDAMMLGAMQLRADWGTSRVEPGILAGIDGSKYGPPYCVQGNEGAWKDAIATTLASLPYSEDTNSWKQDYIEYVKSRCPLYEACRFFVKPLSNLALPQEMYLAVSSTGVSFVNVNTRESLNFLEYAEIASWGYTPTVFSIIAGSMSISADTQFQTTQGLEISNTIQTYVDLIQGIQQKTAQTQSENQENPWVQPLEGVEGTFESVSLASSDGTQGAEMLQPQQPETGERAPGLDPSFFDQDPSPQQAPGFGDEQPWTQLPLFPPGEVQQLSSPSPGNEQQAWHPPPTQLPEEPAERDHKHSKHRRHRKKERKDENRKKGKHSREHSQERPKEKPLSESAAAPIHQIRGHKGGRNEMNDSQQWGNSVQADPQQQLGQPGQVKEESDGSKRRHWKHRKQKKGKHHRENSQERREKKPEPEVMASPIPPVQEVQQWP